MANKKSHPKAAPKKSDAYYADLSAEAQRKRLMDALKLGPITTIEARRHLDILMPAARVRELRLDGKNIQTLWTEQETDYGRPHRVARYVLIREGEGHDIQ